MLKQLAEVGVMPTFLIIIEVNIGYLKNSETIRHFEPYYSLSS